MLKTFYILAWVLVAVAGAVSYATGHFDAITLVFLSLISVGLVYTLGLWAAFTNTPDMMPKVFHRNDELH